MTPTPPPVDNFLRIYTDLATRPNDCVLTLEEFAGLGPKTTIKELTKMWVELHLGIQWTIVVVDPLGFTDSMTAKSRDTMKRNSHGNFESWTLVERVNFAQKVRNTTGTLLILEGQREFIPEWYKEFDRTVCVKAPNRGTLGPATG